MEGVKWTYVDVRTGNKITDNKFDEAEDFYEGLATVSIAGKGGVIDTLGRIVVPLIHPKILAISDRMFIVSNSGKKFALMNASGKVLTQEIYDEFRACVDGIAPARKLNKWGYVNNLGKEICLFVFDDAQNFYNGAAKVGKKSGYETMNFEPILNAGFINSKGVLIAEPKYNYEKSRISNEIVLALDVKNTNQSGYATTGTSYALMDRNGKIIVPFDKNLIFETTYDDCIVVRKPGTSKYGLLGWDGKVLLQSNFSKIEFEEDGERYVTKVFFDNSNYFYLNEKFECFEFKGVACPEK